MISRVAWRRQCARQFLEATTQALGLIVRASLKCLSCRLAASVREDPVIREKSLLEGGTLKYLVIADQLFREGEHTDAFASLSLPCILSSQCRQDPDQPVSGRADPMILGYSGVLNFCTGSGPGGLVASFAYVLLE